MHIMRAKGAFANLYIVTSTHRGSAENSDILCPGSLQPLPDVSNFPKRLRLSVAESLRDSAQEKLSSRKTQLTKTKADHQAMAELRRNSATFLRFRWLRFALAANPRCWTGPRCCNYFLNNTGQIVTQRFSWFHFY